MPASIARLSRDERGYPIPFFAAVVNGKHSLAVVDPEKIVRAVNERLCMICGGKLSALGWFVGGPRTLAAKKSYDGPMHLECAQFSLSVCPHLALQGSQYRSARGVDTPVGASVISMVSDEKPERYALMGTPKFKVVPGAGGLIDFKRPEIVHWYAYDAGRLQKTAA